MSQDTKGMAPILADEISQQKKSQKGIASVKISRSENPESLQTVSLKAAYIFVKTVRLGKSDQSVVSGAAKASIETQPAIEMVQTQISPVELPQWA